MSGSGRSAEPRRIRTAPVAHAQRPGPRHQRQAPRHSRRCWRVRASGGVLDGGTLRRHRPGQGSLRSGEGEGRSGPRRHGGRGGPCLDGERRTAAAGSLSPTASAARRPVEVPRPSARAEGGRAGRRRSSHGRTWGRSTNAEKGKRREKEKESMGEIHQRRVGFELRALRLRPAVEASTRGRLQRVEAWMGWPSDHSEDR